MSIQETSPTVDPIVFGVKNIAPHIGKSVKGAFAALKRAEKDGAEKIPGAKKIAGTWALNIDVYRRSFEAT